MPDAPPSNSVVYFSRELDYLEDLGAKLRNLKGFATLAHELLQNADDVAGVSTFNFNVCDDALIVENDGKFSDCCQPDLKECPWKSSPEHGSHRCDFHRFKIVAGADKRNEANTTGAFGIGFISVYQITDRPELISSGRHWILDETQPPDKRIAQCQDSACARCSNPNLPGTRFYLPWAFDANSTLRQGLRTEPTTPETPSKFFAELEASLPTAMLFLKKTNIVELRRNGQLIRRLERVKQDDALILNLGDGSPDMIWHLLRGNFEDRGTELRALHPTRIEPKRAAAIVIAIPATEIQTGLLCATLPTEQPTGLPFHINADFFPSEDRKRIILGQDYQALWNEAALTAAAAAFAASFSSLRSTLGHQRVWSILSRINQVAQDAAAGRAEKLFAQFWSKLAPSLANQPIIYNHRAEWSKPGEVFYLQQSEEKLALPVLADIGLNCVHEDLRPHQNLLISKEIGVRQLSIEYLAQQLRKVGLTGTFPRDKWPAFLQQSGALRSLRNEVDLLMNRRSLGAHQHHLAGSIAASVAELSLATNRAGALCPCNTLYRSPNDATEQIFLRLSPGIPFTSAETNKFDLFRSLCPQFGPAQAIKVLQNLGDAGFAQTVQASNVSVTDLLSWFTDYRPQILADARLLVALKKLPIYPSGGGYQSLDALSLPGNFRDPLQLAAILDVAVLPKHHEFLRELGIEDLSFPVYVTKHLIPALTQDELPDTKRREAILLLATRRSEISEVATIKESLANLKIVECADGTFRIPGDVYFSNPIVTQVLGVGVPHATIPAKHTAPVVEFFTWLGVTEHPRLGDIADHVQTIVAAAPNPNSIASIQIIFSHLAGRLNSGESTNGLNPLQSQEWLPSKSDQSRWFKPTELYATFQEYLFASQADFLNVASQVQTAASALIEFLGINKSPSPDQVVAHLLFCSENKLPVQQEIYRVLDDWSEKPAIHQLRGKACIFLPEGYIRPDEAFWTDHPFGRFRKKIGEELRRYNDLFKQIGVSESPTPEDAIKVLGEVTAQFGPNNQNLDDAAYAVSIACWQMLESALDADVVSLDQITALKESKCIPNAKHVLTPPSWLFFEDRAGLAAKFQGFLSGNTIPRPLGAAKAMAAAGVNTLAEVVEVLLLERRNPVEDLGLSQRIQERRLQLARVFNAQSGLVTPADQLVRLDSLHFESVEQLRIAYRLKAFGQTIDSSAEDCPALYRPDEAVIIFLRQNERMPWPAIARELAVALCPDEEPGRIAPGIKEVLAADTAEEAKLALDELGFTTLETPVAPPAKTEIVNTLGGAPATPIDPAPPPPGTPQTNPNAGGTGATAGTTTTPPTVQPPTGTPPTGVGGTTGTNGGTSTGGTSTPGGGNTKLRPRQPRRGKLRSYVVKDPTPSEEPPDPKIQERRHAVNLAGIAKVEAFERSLGCVPKVMPQTHPGYDIESCDPNGGILRYIEVKSRSGNWGGDGVGLTTTEFLKAQEHGDLYWLYIVENAETADFKIHCIQNPAGKVDQFFYDDSWQPVEETDHNKMRPPEDW